MKALLVLAIKSLKHRLFSTTLTVLSIALGFCLLLLVERMKSAAEDGFTQSISQVDLIVGARSGPLQLILYTVFNMGDATHNISYSTFEKYSNHPAVDWTIPYTLGDGHRGYRVVGTNLAFFEHYRYRGDRRVEFLEGKAFNQLWDIVLGSEVAERLKYKLGDEIVISHGATKGDSLQNHGDRPFQVVGVMKPTGTVLDRSLYISLQGFEALHIDWESGAQPKPGQTTPKEMIRAEHLKTEVLTAFFLRTKSRIETLKLQREINTDKSEPLLSIIPGVVLSDLWRGLATIENVLRVISLAVVLVAFLAMLISLTTVLNERRREMAILRSLGAHFWQISFLMVLESGVLTLIGILGGWILFVFGILAAGPWLENHYSVSFSGGFFSGKEIILSLILWMGGWLIGLYPAYRATQAALKDGLSR